MIPLATKIEPDAIVTEFPEGLEDDNKQSGEGDNSITEQEQENGED